MKIRYNPGPKEVPLARRRGGAGLGGWIGGSASTAGQNGGGWGGGDLDLSHQRGLSSPNFSLRLRRKAKSAGA
jgi:hypothetical protein